MISSIVVLYEPRPEEYLHICDYYNKVDIVYVLDNSTESHQGEITSVISSKFKDDGKLHYKDFGENIGLCKALNYGMALSQKAGCTWALLMDADSSFITDIMEVYKARLQENVENVAIFAPVHMHDRSSATQYDGEKCVKWAMTSGCLYNVEIFEQVGGFMEELFVDGLDKDYCYRVCEKGYKVVECGNALIKHHPATTRELKIFEKTVLRYGIASPARYRMMARSLIWNVKRYKKLQDFIHYCWCWVKILLLFENKSEYIREMYHGTSEGFKLATIKFKGEDVMFSKAMNTYRGGDKA